MSYETGAMACRYRRRRISPEKFMRKVSPSSDGVEVQEGVKEPIMKCSSSPIAADIARPKGQVRSCQSQARNRPTKSTTPNALSTDYRFVQNMTDRRSKLL